LDTPADRADTPPPAEAGSGAAEVAEPREPPPSRTEPTGAAPPRAELAHEAPTGRAPPAQATDRSGAEPGDPPAPTAQAGTDGDADADHAGEAAQPPATGGTAQDAAGQSPAAGGTTAAGDGPGSAAPAPPTAPAIAVATQPLVVDPAAAADGDLGCFATLRAACEQALAGGGDRIELRFNGPLVEPRPIRLRDIRLTVFAGSGFRPVVVFRPDDPDYARYSRQMFLVTDGQLNLLDVEVVLDVPTTGFPPQDGWTMFEAHAAEQLRFVRCVLTVRNPALHPGISFLEVSAPPGAGMMMMGMEMGADAPPSETVVIRLTDCVVRGEATLLRSDDLQPIALAWENGLLASTEPLYRAAGAAAGLRQPRVGVTLDLDNLTAFVRGGLCELAGGNDAAYHLPTRIDSADSVFLASLDTPPRAAPDVAFIEQAGVADAMSAPGAVEWHGTRNSYQGFESCFWRLTPADAPQSPREWTLAEWTASLGRQSERSPIPGLVLWTALPRDRPAHAHLPADYALDHSSTSDNPAGLSASDGADIGCRIDRLPVPYPLLPGAPVQAAVAPSGGRGSAPVPSPTAAATDPAPLGD
jgi:hypothetical protein